MTDRPNATDAVREAHSALSAAETEWADSPRLFDDTKKLAAAELALIAAVRAEERARYAAEMLDKLSLDPESAVAAQMARAATIAECRKAVEKAPECVVVSGYGYISATYVLAALDALAAEGE